jgi:uncharacterized protein DUF3775
MQSDRHAAVIARDSKDSKALFAQSSRRVDFSRWRLERSCASRDFAGAGPGPAGPLESAGVCSLGLLRIAMADEDVENTPDLSISPDKVCYIIAKAREFDAKDVVTDPDDSSNPTDDAMVAVLEDHRDDPVVQEIAAAIFAMSEDEQIDLVTLAWLGRGDGSLEDWNELRAEAARAHNKRTASYLLGMPLLADYLDEALAQFGHSCDE